MGNSLAQKAQLIGTKLSLLQNYVNFQYYFNNQFAAKLRTSTGMHNDQKYGKSIMTSHKISDRDNGAKMLII